MTTIIILTIQFNLRRTLPDIPLPKGPQTPKKPPPETDNPQRKRSIEIILRENISLSTECKIRRRATKPTRKSANTSTPPMNPLRSQSW
ncbi:hypothetical protein RRF57_000647 [Xylaria bambusicola]|uniref:Uncharacterized protein n=1 Tax=Xylaria bambusicola TaxID=326684 RepID=A0AAN7YZW2_9PEZI